MDPGVELLDRAGSLRSRLGLVVELGPELLERLHDEQAYGVRRSSRAPVSAPELTEQPRGLQRGRGGFQTLVLARALDAGPVECLLVVVGGQQRSEKGRVGKGSGRTGKSRWWPETLK